MDPVATYHKTIILNQLPVENHWSLKPTKQNLDFAALLISLGSTDIFLDTVILSLPLPMIKSLQLSTQRKILVTGVFWLGAL